jgi:hypothetical protein
VAQAVESLLCKLEALLSPTKQDKTKPFYSDHVVKIYLCDDTTMLWTYVKSISS